jgi:hypothetical protein
MMQCFPAGFREAKAPVYDLFGKYLIPNPHFLIIHDPRELVGCCEMTKDQASIKLTAAQC